MICRQADARARFLHEDFLILPSFELGEIFVHVGLTLRCLEADYNRGLVKGMWYKVCCLEPLTVEETSLRYQEENLRRIEVSLETFGRKLTRVEAVTCASVQGATCEGKVAIGDLSNPHMQNISALEMAVGRCREAKNLRFL